jgi:exoribonuclease-2
VTLIPGDLVGAHIDRTPCLGVVRAVQSRKVAVLFAGETRPRLLPPRDLVLLGHRPGHEAATVASPPWNLRGDPQPAWAGRRDLAAAWQLLVAQQSPLALQDLLALLVADPPAAAPAQLWLALQGPQDFFRLGRDLSIQLRTLPELRRLRHQRRRENLSHQARHRWLTALTDGSVGDLQQALDSGAPGSGRDLALLQRWAASPESALAPELPSDLASALTRAGTPLTPVAIRRRLVALGRWDPHALRCMDGTAWHDGFSEDLRAEAARLAAGAGERHPGDETRRDLTGLRCFTIDDPGTEEIDDAVGVERTDDGDSVIWVHIADPARLVDPDTPLDQEARRRATSLYLAAGTIPMFPMELARGPFSLHQGRACPALSASLRLAADGGVATVAVMRSWIRPTYRLSYEEGDELIELAPPGDDDLARLARALDSHRRWRLARGALLLEQNEGRFRREGDRAGIELIEPSAARGLVAEAMILMGTALAGMAREAGLPMPFRSQQSAELPPPGMLETLPAGPVRHAAIKRCLSRGVLGTSPRPHFSLGLPCYVQVTSPIRRYADLLAHRQLQAHLAGRPTLGEAQMQTLLDELEGPLRQASQISREDQRHWQQVFFEQRAGAVWPVIHLRWLREQDGFALVRLENESVDVAATAPADSRPGDALLLHVREVDSVADRLELVATRP